MLAIEYMWRFRFPGAPRLWDRLLGLLVSDEFAVGAGSVATLQQEPYSSSLGAMLVHTVAGGTALVLGPFQLSASLRRRALRLHRWIGRIYLGAVFTAMTGTLLYLTRTAGTAVYTGVPFQWALLGLCALTVVSAILALRAILGRDVQTHQGWMIFNFCMLLTAPGLRLEWILAGNLWPGVRQDTTNLPAATALLPVCILLAILWNGPPRTAPAQSQGLTPALRWSAASAVAGAIAGWILHARLDALQATARYSPLRSVPLDALTALLTTAGIWLVTGALAWRHASRQRGTAAREMLLHHAATAVAPLTALVLFTIVARGGPGPADGMAIALLLALPLNLFVSYAVALARRRTGAAAMGWGAATAPG